MKPRSAGHLHVRCHEAIACPLCQCHCCQLRLACYRRRLHPLLANWRQWHTVVQPSPTRHNNRCSCKRRCCLGAVAAVRLVLVVWFICRRSPDLSHWRVVSFTSHFGPPTASHLVACCVSARHVPSRSACNKHTRIMFQIMAPNPALNLAPFGRWTLRDEAAQRRLALRWAS